MALASLGFGPPANEGADSSYAGIDFVPDAFVLDPVRPGAALYSLEGDFRFSAPNATSPAPEIGHEVKLINGVRTGSVASGRSRLFDRVLAKISEL